MRARRRSLHSSREASTPAGAIAVPLNPQVSPARRRGGGAPHGDLASARMNPSLRPSPSGSRSLAREVDGERTRRSRPFRRQDCSRLNPRQDPAGSWIIRADADALERRAVHAEPGRHGLDGVSGRPPVSAPARLRKPGVRLADLGPRETSPRQGGPPARPRLRLRVAREGAGAEIRNRRDHGLRLRARPGPGGGRDREEGRPRANPVPGLQPRGRGSARRPVRRHLRERRAPPHHRSGGPLRRGSTRRSPRRGSSSSTSTSDRTVSSTAMPGWT